jgi:MoxR-like ATPase
MSASFHRDTNASELLGVPRLRRERRGNAERLAFELAPGPLGSAEVLLLDDLSRAPGEALAPLLRILSERRAAGVRLPLETAIATAGAADLESYADPLEPSQLDRFAVQVRMRGLVSGRRFDRARALLDRDREPPLRHARHRSASRAATLRAALCRSTLRARGAPARGRAPAGRPCSPPAQRPRLRARGAGAS